MSEDGLKYYQQITIDGLVDVEESNNNSKSIMTNNNFIKNIKKKTVIRNHKLYHYIGPVTLYDKIIGRVDQYIHANSIKQALFLLQKDYVKNHPKISYINMCWFDEKYIKEVEEEE